MRKLTLEELCKKAELNLEKEVKKNPDRVFVISSAGPEYTVADWFKSIQSRNGIGYEAMKTYWEIAQPNEDFEFAPMREEEDFSDLTDLI